MYKCLLSFFFFNHLERRGLGPKSRTEAFLCFHMAPTCATRQPSESNPASLLPCSFPSCQVPSLFLVLWFPYHEVLDTFVLDMQQELLALTKFSMSLLGLSTPLPSFAFYQDPNHWPRCSVWMSHFWLLEDQARKIVYSQIPGVP